MVDVDTQLRTLLLGKMLLHGQVTRGQIAKAFGVTPAAVTRHARWLREHHFVTVQTVKLPRVKRPVEVLRLNGARGTAAALQIGDRRIDGELVGADGGVVMSFQEPLGGLSQLHVIEALRRTLSTADTLAEQLGREVSLVGLGVHGHLEPASGVIFDIDFCPDWQPCLPAQLLFEEGSGRRLMPWTRVACKLRGLASRLGLDDGVGYVESDGRSLAVASLKHDHVVHGRFGTGSSAAHQTVAKAQADEPQCYCGRRGCLTRLLADGRATPEIIQRALPRIVTELCVGHLGVEWDADETEIRQLCRQAGVDEFVAVHDPDEVARMGLRHLSAKVLLLNLAESTRRPVVRREVDSSPLAQKLPLPALNE